ncbi:MAG: N-acetylmuramoyl-L-alanine amidase [Novosphingobium sp.]|nr:N-acetylmuramoyl-L-alanine amidase [Novosphingobium sp.]
MVRYLQLALIVIAPLAVLAGAILFDRYYGVAGRGYDYVIEIALAPAGDPIDLPEIMGPNDASRPLVVLDPGHGGHDPGAGKTSLKEKTLTLRLARALRDKLLEQGGVRVAMTRDDDRYLQLAERSSIARRLKADLFLSIHADSIEEGDASGASVYTLSEKGTSEAAARYADKENRADAINGVVLADTADAVSAILLDLSQRETQRNSEEFARLILRETRGKLRLRDDTVQSAAFAVLKSPDLPSVLMETGYISNANDAAILASAEGQSLFADATAGAIRAYLARKAGT